jgi:hypothetical protein
MGAPRIIYRYVSGRPMGWLPSADGGYLRRGSASGVGPWGRLPGWQRQAWRLGVPGATVSTLMAHQAHPDLTVGTAAVAGAVSGVHSVRVLRRRWRMRRFNATYVRPTLAALRPSLGDAPLKLRVDPELGNLVGRLAKPMSPAERAAREWYGEHVEPVVRWLPDRAMRGAWAAQKRAEPALAQLAKLRRPGEDATGPRIRLEASVPYLTAEQRQYVSSVVGAKIPAGDMVESWDQVGQRVCATWTVRRRPPAHVGYADLAARFSGLQEWEFFVGLGVGGKPVIISLKDDSPHIACSAGSGAGKSVLARAIAVQVLARGGRVFILDRKGSHRWALGLPGVDYCTSAEQMHKALMRLAELADQRNADALHMPEDWDPGQRVFVIAEELNATFSQMKDYWEETRDRGAPKTSPAVKGFRNLLFMGRSAKINVFAVAQMLTANTTGGPESRENFGIRCLARYTVNAWKMLVPEASMPRVSRTLGRWQVVVAGTATETQVVHLTDHEARLLIAKISQTDPVPRENSRSAPFKGDRATWETPAPVDPLSECLTIRDAVDRGLVPWKFENTRKRLQNARKNNMPSAPVSVGKDGNADLYRVGDMIAWIEQELGVAADVEPVEVDQ